MNIPFISDRADKIIGHVQFVDGAVYTFQMHLSGRGTAVHTIVGRTPQELEKLFLEFDGLKSQFPVVRRSDGEIEPIEVHTDRDKWTDLLRRAAWKAVAESQE